MPGSGSYARGDQPRSVPDPHASLYDKADAWQRAHNAQQESDIQRRRRERDEAAKRLGDRIFSDPPEDLLQIGHPGAVESLAPVWGSGREALADLSDDNYLGAILNGALAVSDAIPAKAVGGVVLKGGIKVSGPFVWRTKPWEAAKGVRQWMSDINFAKPGQPVHHWAIPQGGWGKNVPDWFKNQLWNAKPTTDAVEHGRIHGSYKVDGVKLPQFDAVRRFWYGTPDWFKALNISVPGHAGTAAGRSAKDRPNH